MAIHNAPDPILKLRSGSFNRKPLPEYLPLLVIVLVGFGLRLYHLGTPSFWYDEVCQVEAAIAPTISAAFQILRQQIMAMPLDFMVVWLFARIGSDEATLRLPALIWGTLSLVIAYRLFFRLTDRKTALFATLLLALSPLHIRYSQEVRYYSSLVFFYLLATERLFAAIERPTRWHWSGFVIATVVGTYFHPFVLLCFTNGFVWLGFKGIRTPELRSRWIPFVISGVICLLAFGATYFASMSKTTPIPFDHFELFMAYALIVGLGWIPQVYTLPGPGWIAGILIFVFGVAGFVYSLRSPRREIRALAVSIILQIVLLITAIYFLYFPEPRQFLEVLPMTLLFSAIGAVEFLKGMNRSVMRKSTGSPTASGRFSRVIGAVLIGFWILSSVPALNDYYHSDRSRAMEISQILGKSWSKGNLILVMPDTQFRPETLVYQYYFQNRLGMNEIVSALKGTDWDRLKQDALRPGKIFLITGAPGPSPYLSSDQLTMLQQLGFQSAPIGDHDDAHLQRLWVKE